MTKLSKIEAQKVIYDTFQFIDSGIIERNGDSFFGHPGLYFFHSKDELMSKTNFLLKENSYDKYDLYYIINSLIKYMLGKYDSHTKVLFKNSTFLPIKFKISDGKVYITNHSPDIENCKGATLVSINNVEIKKILDELENIICYSTKEYLQTMQEFNMRNLEILKSLPSILNDIDTITFQVLYNNQLKNISFNEKEMPSPFQEDIPKNYSYELLDNAIVIHYNSCKSATNNEMTNLIKNIDDISKEKNINNYIVDLRDNSGGDSRIIAPLIEYLKEKNIVVLVNEKVFSSGSMAYLDLKKIGAYSIGTDISTSLNHFGNVPGSLTLEGLDLIVKRSSTYWFYDEDFRCTGYRKDSFADYFNTRRELLEPMIIHPDEYSYLTVDDILTGNDTQMMSAINHINKKRLHK